MPDMHSEMRESFDRLPKYMQSMRKRSCMTQVEVAKLAGITSTAVAYIERGTRMARIETICVLLEVYGSSLQQLAVDLNL